MVTSVPQWCPDQPVQNKKGLCLPRHESLSFISFLIYPHSGKHVPEESVEDGPYPSSCPSI